MTLCVGDARRNERGMLPRGRRHHPFAGAAGIYGPLSAGGAPCVWSSRPSLASFVRVLAFVPASTLVAGAAHASGPLFFLHGGRPTAQAGAFVGRATDA